MRKKALKNIKVLTEEEIHILSDLIETVTFNKSVELYYQGHVPLAGHVFYDGDIIFTNRSNKSERAMRGSVIGVWELYHNKPLKMSAQIESMSVVGILDRSTIIEIFNHSDPIVRNIMLRILE